MNTVTKLTRRRIGRTQIHRKKCQGSALPGAVLGEGFNQLPYVAAVAIAVYRQAHGYFQRDVFLAHTVT